jgi:hypothetical protein
MEFLARPTLSALMWQLRARATPVLALLAMKTIPARAWTFPVVMEFLARPTLSALMWLLRARATPVLAKLALLSVLRMNVFAPLALLPIQRMNVFPSVAILKLWPAKRVMMEILLATTAVLIPASKKLASSAQMMGFAATSMPAYPPTRAALPKPVKITQLPKKATSARALQRISRG